MSLFRQLSGAQDLYYLQWVPGHLAYMWTEEYKVASAQTESTRAV